MSGSEASDGEQPLSDRSSRFFSRQCASLRQESEQMIIQICAQLKQSIFESMADLKTDLSARIESSKLEASKTATQIQEQLVNTTTQIQEQLAKTAAQNQEQLVNLSNRLEEHIRESREEKIKMRKDIENLTKRLDNIDVSVNKKIEENNVILHNEIKQKTDVMCSNILESVKELSAKTVENSLKEMPELIALSKQISKTESEMEQVKIFVTEMKTDFEIIKDSAGEFVHASCNKDNNSGLVSRVSQTEMRIQELTKQLNHMTNNHNMIEVNNPTHASTKDDICTVFVNEGNNKTESRTEMNKNSAISLTQEKSNPVLSTAELLEEISASVNSNTVNRFPTFKPGSDIHPVIFIKAFENSFPVRWSDNRKIQFVIGYLEAEAAEWAVLHRDEFRIFIWDPGPIIDVGWTPSM